MKKFTNVWKWMMILLMSSSVLVLYAQQNVSVDKAPTKVEQKEEMKSQFNEKQLNFLEKNGLMEEILFNEKEPDPEVMLKLMQMAGNYKSNPFESNNNWNQIDAVGTYTFSQIVDTYTEISGGISLGTITTDDQRFVDPDVPAGGTTTTGPGFPIGFDFTFDGVVFDRIAINANGWISLGQSSLTPSVNNASTSAYTPISSTTAITPDDLVSRIAAFGRDLQAQAGAELRIETIGTSPNQECVIQWKNYRKYNNTGDNYNFQIRLLEDGNLVKFVYGTMINNATAATPQVGLRAAPSATATNFANRTTTTDWTATTAGGSNTATCTLSSTVYPPSGLTFIYTPPVAGTPYPPTNPSPANAASGIPISGDLTWDFGISTVTYDLWFGPAGSMVQVVTGGTAGASGSYTYSGLAYSSNYHWQVIAYNGALTTDGPVWNFYTECGAISTLPWTEDFEGLATVGSKILPICWSYENVVGTSGPTSSSTTGTYYGPYSGTKFFYMHYNNTTWAFTPGFSLTAGTSYDFSFYMMNKYITNPVDFVMDVAYGDTQNSAGMTNVLAAGVVCDNNTYVMFQYTIVPNVSGDYYFGVKTTSVTSTPWYVSFDDFRLELTPDCPNPQSLGATAITGVSADLTWTSFSGLSDIEFGPYGFTPTGTPTYSGVTSPYQIGGLSPTTQYSFYVRDNCGGGQYSNWVGPYSFYTACASFIAPFVEHFQNTTIPLCWTMSGPQAWLFTTTWPGYGAAGLTDHTGTGGSFAGVDGSGTVSLTGITLLTPLIDVSALTVPQLRFYIFNNNTNNTDWQSLRVDLWDGANWNNSIYYWGPTDNNPDWVEVMVVLAAYNITGDIQIRFVVDKSAGSPFYDDLIIDDVYVEEAPTCPAPAVLGVANVTQTSADLTWTSFSGLSDIEFGLAGFTPTGVPTYSGVVSPYNVTGLTGVTSYSFYVRDDCGGGDYSLWTGPFTFLTMPATTGIPVYEDFENGFVYFNNAPGNQVNWAISNTYYHIGAQSAHNPYGNTNQNVLHETSVLDLSTAAVVFLEFWHIAKIEGDFDHAYIEISTDGGATYAPLPQSTYTGSGIYEPALYNNPVGPCFDEDSYPEWGTGSEIPDNATWWRQETFDLSSYLVNNVRIRFRLHSDGSILRYGWLIDEIMIYEPAYGTLAGTVTNAANSAPIQGATITVGSLSATTGADGTYNLPGILIGTWNANCTATGYNPASASVTIIEDQTTTQNFSLTAPNFVVNPLTVNVTLEPNELYDDFVNMSNSGLGTVNWSAGVVVVGDGGSDALFDLQFDWPVGNASGEAGIETDGSFIYTSLWNGTQFCKYDMNGTYIGTFTCGSAGAIRDLAYDGTYFYGAAAATTVFQMDFTNGVVVSSFTAPLAVRAIAYNEDENVFYGNNWSDAITKFDMTGANLGSFACGPYGSSYYGFAYDNYSDEAPYLWGYAQVGNTLNELVQIQLPTGVETGVTFDVGSVAAVGTGIAGGLAITDAIIPGFYTILGTAQNVNIWGLELCESGPVWLTIAPNSGILGPGTNADMTLHFNATDILPGIYMAEIHYSTSPNVGSPVVNVTMTVEGLIPPINLTAGYVCTDVNLTWQMPTGGDPDSWNIYKDGVLLGSSTVMSYTDSMVMTQVELGYYVKAVYAGEESMPSATKFITVPNPGNLQPIGLVAQASTPSPNYVTLTWNEPNACLDPDGYNVYRDGVMVNTSLVTEQTYIDGPLGSGLYEYKLKAVYYFGESGFSSAAYALIPVGIEENNDGAFNIYPNPASNMVTIESALEIRGIRIFSNAGQLVADEQVNATRYQVDVSQFDKGIYYIRIETKDTKVFRKITVN